MEDCKSLNEPLKIHKYFPDFFSVLLPELGRPVYLDKCLDSIHTHADLPVEIIVHDDGSGPVCQAELARWRNRISTLVLNHGHNMGLARSFNRCRQMSSSPYLIGFNTDTYMTSPFLANMKAALDLPYVGIVNVVPSLGEGPGVHVTAGGVKVALAVDMGACHAFGIRSEVWDELGGWDEHVQTTSSDVGFMGNAFGAGYFSVRVEGTVFNEMWENDGKINTPAANEDYISCTHACRDDINVPPIFKIPKLQHDRCCRQRWEAIYARVNTPRLTDPNWKSWYGNGFLRDETVKLFRESNPLDIDWEFAKTYGHARWRDRIIADFNL